MKAMRKLLCLLTAVCLSVCPSCVPLDVQPPETLEPPSPVVESPESETADVYTVVFEADEIFSTKAEEKASARIDGAIRTAVKIMNTVNTEPIPVLDCDYAARPGQRDLLKDPLSVEIYDVMLEKVSAFEDYCFRQQDYPGVDLFNVCVSAGDALRIDRTDLFLYCDTKMDGTEYRSAYFMPGYWLNTPCDDREAIRDEVALCDAVVARILEKMPAGLSNFEKCWYFALVLSAGVEYNYAEEYPLYDYQAYSAFVEGIAVCSGYAQAFYRLCRDAGISCWYCRGTTPTGRHAWNMLDTEAGPVYMDVTWYDTDTLQAHYREGKWHYLFMTQEDFDYYGYVQESCQ